MLWEEVRFFPGLPEPIKRDIRKRSAKNSGESVYRESVLCHESKIAILLTEINEIAVCENAGTIVV
jgi:hypothetical protein